MMSLLVHDRMALKAFREGQTSLLYHRAAQGNANKFWAWLAIGGIVWYFAGWMWALIPFALGVLRAVMSISSTMVAARLEKIQKSSNPTSEGASQFLEDKS